MSLSRGVIVMVACAGGGRWGDGKDIKVWVGIFDNIAIFGGSGARGRARESHKSVPEIMIRTSQLPSLV